MNQLKINNRILSVAAFSCLFAYLLSFVFEGQVLYSTIDAYGAKSNTYILTAIVAHFAGLFSCGFFVKTPRMGKARHACWSIDLLAFDLAVLLLPLRALVCGTDPCRLCRWLCGGGMGLLPQKVHAER